MISIVNELNNIIKSEFHESKIGNKVILNESKSVDFLPVTIDFSNVNAFCISTDKDGLILHPLLEDGVNKTVDFIIFAEDKKGENLFIFSIECKTNKTSGWKTQAKAGLVIGHYILGMLEAKLTRTYENVEHRCLLFSLKGEKRRTKERKIKYEIDKHFNYKFLHKRCGTELKLSRYLV
ncbi:MAG: hypothetical protein AB8G11_15405 [Saprospiraceae bacterium]